MPDSAVTLAVVRDALPSLARETYLNTGGAGPVPLVAARAVERAVATALRRGRGGLDAERETSALHDALRAALATALSGHPDEIAIAGSSTHALNAVIWGIDWSPGDEAVTTSLEHPGLAAPLRRVAQRRGVHLRVVALDRGDEDLEALIGAVVGPRTRLVALSHVAYSTGARLDVEGAARAARAAGALVLVDGAQGLGAVPTDPRALGADAYAVAAHKWLLGPEGLGALWVRREAIERIAPTFTGFASGTGHLPDGRLALHPGARRLEISTLPDLLVPGWLASLAWLGELGWDWIHARVAEAAAAARERLSAIPGVEVLTPAGHQAGLIVYRIAGVDPEAADARLQQQGIRGRWVPHPRALRVSAGFYTDDADLDRMASAVSLIASGA
jgi:L-cysteine/cystine lyase